jgi:hypothetical protein
MSLLIIAGTRTAREIHVRSAIAGYPWLDEVTQVISGNATGADRFGEKWANENNIEVIKFNPSWEVYGKSAGMRRNAEMAQNADSLLACYDGSSRGTSGMIMLAKRYNLKIAIYYYFEDRFEYFNKNKSEQLKLIA